MTYSIPNSMSRVDVTNSRHESHEKFNPRTVLREWYVADCAMTYSIPKSMSRVYVTNSRHESHEKLKLRSTDHELNDSSECHELKTREPHEKSNPRSLLRAWYVADCNDLLDPELNESCGCHELKTREPREIESTISPPAMICRSPIEFVTVQNVCGT